MTEEECEMVFQGHEDAQGNVNYEGKKLKNYILPLFLLVLTL